MAVITTVGMTIQDVNIVPLFSTPVLMYEVEIEEKEKLFLLNHYPDNILLNAGNTSSKDRSILDNVETKGLKEKLHYLVNDAFTHIYSPQSECGLYITQSWLNFTTKDQFHHRHTHPNSFYSAVLYLKVTEGDNITFYDVEPSNNFLIDSNHYGLFNSNSWDISVKDNLLLIFPSTLSHSVSKVLHDNLRVSLSFNTFLRGEFGQHFDLNHLAL